MAIEDKPISGLLINGQYSINPNAEVKTFGTLAREAPSIWDSRAKVEKQNAGNSSRKKGRPDHYADSSEGRKSFVADLTKAYSTALKEAGIDPIYTLMLVAQDAHESWWGTRNQASYNYGNMTLSPPEQKKWAYMMGNDHDADGKAIKNPFALFNSLEDFAKFKVWRFTRPKGRYANAFKGDPDSFMQRVKDAGYATSRTYVKDWQDTYKKVLNMVTPKALNGVKLPNVIKNIEKTKTELSPSWREIDLEAITPQQTKFNRLVFNPNKEIEYNEITFPTIKRIESPTRIKPLSSINGDSSPQTLIYYPKNFRTPLK